MTTVLLDTHAYVWAVSAPDRLGESARALLTDATTAVLVSAATVWEMATKHRLGRWPEAEMLLRRHEQVLGELGGGALPVDHEDALLAGGMSWEHRDPFDRVLAAQALRRTVPLLTRDQAFASIGGLTTVW